MKETGQSSVTKRPRGRPPGQDSALLRERILNTAEVMFARQGFAATSVREIAEEVGVTPAMVHYYFGSKIDLLRQVLAQTFEPLAGAIAQMKAAGRAPAADISKLLFDTVRDHPNLPVLMIREVMLPGGTMQEEFLATMAPRLGGALPAMMAVEQQQGRLASDLDPNVVALLLLALSVFPFIVRDVAGPGLGIAYDEAGLDAMQNHITRLLGEGFSK